MESKISEMMGAADRGDLPAATALLTVLYAELHRLAKRELARHGGPLTLGATTLLHEAYLDMAARDGPSFPDRAWCMGYAAQVMRGLIIDHARSRRAQKHGGGFELTTFDTDVRENRVDDQELARVGVALDELAQTDSDLAPVVDLRFSCGFGLAEIAAPAIVPPRPFGLARPRALRYGRARMGDRFRATRWSVVLSAARGGEDSAKALAWLCESCWYPLYAFVRCQGYDADDARDLTQSFFLSILEKDALRGVDLEHAERRYALEAPRAQSPDRLFESRWARTVLDRAFRRLSQEHEAADRGDTFRKLRGYLAGDEPAYAEVAGELGTTAGAVRVEVHRLRRCLGALLWDEVAQTVADPQDVDGELRSLLDACGRDA